MGLEIYTNPSVFTSLSVNNLVASLANITNVSLTSVNAISATNGNLLADRFIASQFVHTNSLTAVTLTASNIIYAQGGNSQLWNAAHSLVQANSASWEESAEVLPTVTNYLSTSNVQVSALSVSTPVIANYDVITVTSSRTFTNADNSKVFHFNTSSSSLCAIFPSASLSNGFNVGIVNVGTGTVVLSSDVTINAPGTQNSTPYSGMFIYEVNNTFFGVGVFD